MSPTQSTSGGQRRIGGRYRLLRSIGQGGMGTVWEADDDLLNRRVAVKEVRFPPELAEAELASLRARTMREARATARLSHPNVVTTYDVVEEDGRPWIVMELLASRSLAHVMGEDGSLSPQRVAEIGLDVLSALEASHAQGVVHRDVKPSNVLLTPEGRAVLTDFGIAAVAGDPALTSTGVVLGSPAYLPPERARGEPFGPASDLWSLGATLFAATEGRPPFLSDSALGTLTAVISDPVPPLSVGGPLAEAVAGLMRKDPAARHDVARTRELLRTAAAAEALPATVPAEAVHVADRTRVVPAGGVPVERARRPAYGEESPPRRVLLPLALGVAVLLVAGLTGLALLNGGGDQPGTTATPTRSPATATSPSPKTSPSRTPSSPPASSPPQSSPPPPSTPAAAAAGVPDGFRTYRDGTGFTVAVPRDWAPRRRSATAVDLVSPDGTMFLRIDQTNQPKDDPAADWRRQERSVRNRLPGYQRVDISAVDYRGWPAADWEFTFVPDEATVHVRNRGFVTGPDRGYALYLSAPDSRWDAPQTQQVFQVAADTFRPAT